MLKKIFEVLTIGSEICPSTTLCLSTQINCDNSLVGYEAYDLVISLNQTFQNSCSTCVYTKALTIIHRIAALCKIQRDEAQLSGNEARSLVTRASI